MIKMEINAGLRFGNTYMSGLRRSSRPSQFRCKQVFFVLHILLRTEKSEKVVSIPFVACSV